MSDRSEPARVVLAHGFTQTARSWAEFEALLAERLDAIETVAVDMPGHGDCTAPSDADLWAAAEHLVDLGGTAHYLGYSMGGRIALHAALRAPDRVRSLVLVGATAGIDDEAERAARREADERLAERIESIGVEAFVDEWLTNALFAGLDARSARRGDRLRNTVAGLAASLRSTGTGTQEPLWNRLGEITRPVLVLAGEHDAKFRALGERLAAGLPHATFHVIAGAGHTAHLERPAATADAVAGWFRSTVRP